jgi:alpha-1,2-rhamnosyltransferase
MQSGAVDGRAYSPSGSQERIMSEAVIYIDCTNTTFRDKKTGIERVVNKILDRLPALRKVYNMEFVPVIAIGGQFYRIRSQNRRRASKLCYSLLAFVRSNLDRVFSKQKGADIPVDRVEATPKDIHSKVVMLARSIMPTIFKIAFRMDGMLTNPAPVIFQPEDILFLPDSIANFGLYQAIRNIDSLRFKIILFLHDIIALQYEGVYEASLHNNFKTNYDIIIRKACSVICTSKTVMNDVIQYNGLSGSHILYDYSYLGADFSIPDNTTGIKSDMLNEVFSGSVYLMVGTIEPRKNHLFVLNAFIELWNRGVNASLCIVGKLGWLYDEILERLTTNPALNTRLFIFNDINDEELVWCYKRAKALIFASISEGFGLPLVEAMYFGKPVLASDIPVFREIGADYPYFFSLEDPIHLANIIEAYELGATDKQFSPRSCITWDDAVRNLMGKVIEISKMASLTSQS